MKRIAVTGRPGVGKSTVVAKAAEEAAEKFGIRVGGIRTAEIRVEGVREGFSIRDLASGKEGILSHVRGSGPRIGKYHVDLEALEEIGAAALQNALECDLVVIDEVGPMELKSESFVSAVEEVLDSDRPVLAVLHRSSKHPLARRIRETFEVITVDEKNRNRLPEKLAARLQKKRSVRLN